jgi:thiamine pyrophosphate-dependent acetolactate synthase large subunit-like protein
MGLAPQIDEHHQKLIHESDLMVAVGLDPVELRPDWLHAWPNEKPLIYFGVSPSELIHSNQVQVLGEQQYDHNAYVMSDVTPLQVKGPIFSMDGIYAMNALRFSQKL